MLKYLTEYGADIIGLQEVSTYKTKSVFGGDKTADWFDVLNRSGDGLTASGYTCVTGKNIYWGQDYSTSLKSEHEKTCYNPIYFRTDKYRLIDNDTKWLTSTPDVPSIVDGADTYKALNYVVLEVLDENGNGTNEYFIYVNVHLSTPVKDGDAEHCYAKDTDGNRTTISVQALQVIHLRAILNELQNEYDCPTFISGDFNKGAGPISNWFKGSYVDDGIIVTEATDTLGSTTRSKDMIVAGKTLLTEKPESNTEDVSMTYASNIANYTTGSTYASCAASGAFNKIASWNPIDLWFVSNFDGIVHTYEIIDNKFEEPNADGSNNRYPSDHLPAKLYVTLYTK